ncbi:putative uracil phosphoribosyltransferase [Meira miltonrushii]|uniref:uracil phosphoribosyltransferase n=1 Tax=Meira miltonrushii TaxID=1280837 RepID=A0A316V8J5_9BASI|nr:putative uracil phosphoribosyltransferase [Meira miltonrushii]PWN31805.1 putative uracil phosphoribosyltransferase [Meira miltonrushii]
MSINIVSHPLLKHHLANLRLASTSPKEFRQLISTISSIVAIEATKQLDSTHVQGQGPLSQFQGEEIKERIGLVPILRAGLGMVDATLALMPESTTVLHIGLFREKVSLQPVEYYSKLPSDPTVDRVFILDPLVATGGTAITCVNMIKEWGIPIQKITLLSVLGSESGLQAIAKAWPELDIWVGQVDPVLNEKGYVLPGLGDTGDRLFNTV